jgi:hypothetical protein
VSAMVLQGIPHSDRYPRGLRLKPAVEQSVRQRKTSYNATLKVCKRVAFSF